MQALNDYLARYFFDKSQFAEASRISIARLDDLLAHRLIPAPSYIVANSVLRSAVFGEQSAPGATAGEYFHRDMVVWMGCESLEHTFKADLADAGLQARFDSMWSYFLDGTYGLCVAHPTSVRAIAHKELLQEELVALTNNGTRRDFSAAERRQVLVTIAAYDTACMPFSPLDYPLSSRKRLIDDLRAALNELER